MKNFTSIHPKEITIYPSFLHFTNYRKKMETFFKKHTSIMITRTKNHQRERSSHE